jgi:hypothetical protein
VKVRHPRFTKSNQFLWTQTFARLEDNIDFHFVFGKYKVFNGDGGTFQYCRMGIDYILYFK